MEPKLIRWPLEVEQDNPI